MAKKDTTKFEVPPFRRAAKQRLDAARYLSETEDFRLEAIYLALYAAESALKALILARLREHQRKSMVKKFISDGERSHYFPYLKAKLEDVAGVLIPIEIVEQVRPIELDWVTGLRYQAGKRSRDEAKPFLDAAARALHAWVAYRPQAKRPGFAPLAWAVQA
jgi:HEPN domain-containing protein